MKRSVLASLAAAVTAAVASSGWLACVSSGAVSRARDAGAGSGGDAGRVLDGGLMAMGVTCTDTAAAIYADPGDVSALANGDVIKCTVDPEISVSDLQASANANVSEDDPPAQNIGYTGKPFTSGAHVYRILYRTTRGDANGSAGYASAKIFMPDTPRVAGPLPLLVGAHGTWGQAGKCAASTGQSLQWIQGDYEAQAYPMVGGGLPIIMPDLAGYANFGANGNPPSAYAQYLDVGRSTLDAARAMAKVFPNAFSGKVALLGHSQGGQTSLSALAIQSSYAPELNIAAVAEFAPLWLSQRSWGALLFEASSYPLATNPTANAVSIWYHYTHGELLDGPGHGLDVFAADKQALITSFVNQDCDAQGWDGATASEYPDLQDAATTATDLFDPNFVSSVALYAALGFPCPSGDDLCTKWLQRYSQDRPSLQGINVPTLIEYGQWDDTIVPGRMACVTQIMQEQSFPYTFCLNLNLGHEGTLRSQASYVADWIASKTLGEAAPPPCALSDVNMVTDDAGLMDPLDDAGTPITCLTPPPNK
jgi:hypothetical protein